MAYPERGDRDQPPSPPRNIATNPPDTLAETSGSSTTETPARRLRCRRATPSAARESSGWRSSDPSARSTELLFAAWSEPVVLRPEWHTGLVLRELEDHFVFRGQTVGVRVVAEPDERHVPGASCGQGQVATRPRRAHNLRRRENRKDDQGQDETCSQRRREPRQRAEKKANRPPGPADPYSTPRTRLAISQSCTEAADTPAAALQRQTKEA